jgi:hypothetical protein
VAVADLKTSLDQDDLDWVKPHLDEAEAQIERGEGIEGDEVVGRPHR